MSVIASFPSNELHTPLLPVAMVAGIILLGLLYVLLRLRKLGIGILAGAGAFALATAILFWPRELREPRALNPGPLVVIFGAILGALAGIVAALLGKLIHRLSTARAAAIVANQVRD